LGAQDYGLLGGTTPEQLATIGETGLTPGAGEGLQLPQVPALASMGGGQGLSVPVSGGTVTGAGFTPCWQLPPLVTQVRLSMTRMFLGQPVIQTVAGGSTLSLTDALRGMNLANQLMAGQQQPMGMPQQQAPFQPAGVDYSGILGLLGQSICAQVFQSLLGPAQIRYPSLLG
jgi:hypothetical protein